MNEPTRAQPAERAGSGYDNGQLVRRLALVLVLMFGFGFALVPLYRFVCDITGFSGRTSQLLEAAESGQLAIDESRLVELRFTGTVGAGLPWRFEPVQNKLMVHPGQEYTVEFFAVNNGGGRVVGTATPAVAPNQAARYLLKTECFCFDQQPLEGGEQKRMPVRFVLDPELPASIDSVLLAYTFYPSPEVAGR